MGIESAILAVTLALWAMGFLLLPRLRRGGENPESHPGLPVSVIIPARNEEHNLPTLLRSITSQSVKPREVIVKGSVKGSSRVIKSQGVSQKY